MSRLYYQAPSDEVFDEVKAKSAELWSERYPEGDHPFYAKEKVDRIKGIGNSWGNMMFIVAMFDRENQSLLAGRLSPAARRSIRERMIDGGIPRFLIPF